MDEDQQHLCGFHQRIDLNVLIRGVGIAASCSPQNSRSVGNSMEDIHIARAFDAGHQAALSPLPVWRTWLAR